MNFSLDRLVKTLSDEDFKYLSEEFSDEQLKLVKKGIYLGVFKRFNEDELPDKNKIFSSLKDSEINEKEYERALNVWKVFKIKDLGQYHDLYLKTDVLLLCDVFVDTCLNLFIKNLLTRV